MKNFWDAEWQRLLDIIPTGGVCHERQRAVGFGHRYQPLQTMPAVASVLAAAKTPIFVCKEGPRP